MALGEVAQAIQPRAFWYELTARQLRPMVISGAVRIFYVAEVGPVDEGYEAEPNALDWEDFVHPVGNSRCDLCNDPLPPGEGVYDWAGTDMHVCEHHELALSSVATLGMLVGVATGAYAGSSASGRRLQWLLMLSHMAMAKASATAKCIAGIPSRVAHLGSQGSTAGRTGWTPLVCLGARSLRGVCGTGCHEDANSLRSAPPCSNASCRWRSTSTGTREAPAAARATQGETSAVHGQEQGQVRTAKCDQQRYGKAAADGG